MVNSVNGKQTFGAGRFLGFNNVTNPTPLRAILPQDMSIDFKRGTKSLFGANQFAAAVAAGEMTITGKVSMGATNARIFTDLMFSDAGVTGQILQADKEAGTIPTTPFQVTVTNSASWTTDLGVTKTDGTIFTRVASAPTTGQYSVAAGVYTFAAADTTIAVLISYLYTAAGVGEKVTLANPLQGPASAFTAVMVFPYGTAQDVLTLNNAIASDSGIAAKIGDFTKPTLAFECATDVNDSLGTFSFAQAA